MKEEFLKAGKAPSETLFFFPLFNHAFFDFYRQVDYYLYENKNLTSRTINQLLSWKKYDKTKRKGYDLR